MTSIRDFFTPLGVATLLALGACSSTPPTRPAAGTAAPGAAAARPSLLAAERQWLQSWFRDTPVAIAQRADGGVSVDVPREFSFEAGRSQVRPALAAVLDKVAESLRRVPQARLPVAAAPADTGAATSHPSTLALQRANQVRAHLLSRGVSAAQMGPPTATAAAAVQLRLEVAATP